MPLTTRAAQEQRRVVNNLDAAPGILPMEFAKLGDLNTWLKKLAGADSHLPPEALWRIFNCLVKACNAMAWPPFLRSPGLRYGNPLLEDIPDDRPGVPGEIPNPPIIGFEGLVHFDLDPKNSMLHLPRSFISSLHIFEKLTSVFEISSICNWLRPTKGAEPTKPRAYANA